MENYVIEITIGGKVIVYGTGATAMPVADAAGKIPVSINDMGGYEFKEYAPLMHQNSTLLPKSSADTWASIFALPYDNFRLQFPVSYPTGTPDILKQIENDGANPIGRIYEVQRVGRNGLIFQNKWFKWAFTSDGGARVDVSLSDLEIDTYTEQVGVIESQDGYYHSNTGAFIPSSGWKSKKFDLSTITTPIVASASIDAGVFYLGVYFDENDNYIGYEPVSPVPIVLTDIVRHLISNPLNAKYFGLISKSSTYGVLESAEKKLKYLDVDTYETDKEALYSAIDDKITKDSVYISPVSFNDQYSTPSANLFLTDSQEYPSGIIENIKLKTSSAGILKLAALRKIDNSPKFKAIKFFDIAVSSGINDLFLEEYIEEPFHLGVMKNSVSFLTAIGNVGASADLYYSSILSDSSVFSSSAGRSINIEIKINISKKQYVYTGKSICLCGDSITDFCDSVNTIDGVQYIGYDKVINRKLKFTNIYNNGYSGIKLAQSGGFANTKINSLPFAEIFVVYLGTNDFALTTQSQIGSISDYINNTGVNTFYGAFRVLIDGIYTKGAKKIFICTPTHRNYSGLNSWDSINSNGNTLYDFAKAIKEVCQIGGHTIIDLFSESGINRNTLSTFTMDNLHPNTFGYQMIGDCITKHLENGL